MREIHINLTKLLADQHEAGRSRGYDEGLAVGEDRARARLLARLDRLIAERSGSSHDVGGIVLREARERLAATVEDITPPSARDRALARAARPESPIADTVGPLHREGGR